MVRKHIKTAKNGLNNGPEMLNALAFCSFEIMLNQGQYQVKVMT